MSTGLAEAIHGFDGTTQELRAAAEAFQAPDAEILSSYLSSTVDRHRIAASWIAKSLIENGRGDFLELPEIFARLEQETAWEVQLHLLQSVQYAPDAALPQNDTLMGLLDHPKTLVAVWALDTWVRVALVRGDSLHMARSRVDAALSDPRASMRARARHLAPPLDL